jgi:hypothetical protein
LAIGDWAADGHHHRGLPDRLGLHGLAWVLALDQHPAALAVPEDLRVVLSAIPLRSVVLLLAHLPVVPVVVLRVAALAAAQVSVLLLGSVSGLLTPAVSLLAHLAVAQAFTPADLVVVLLAHLRVQADPTVVLPQVGRRDVDRDHPSDLRGTLDAERDAEPLRR